MRVTQVAAGAVIAALLGLLPAQAERRVALVVGNDRYANLSADRQLQKAVNDARAVGEALGQIGFEVIRGENLGRQALVDKLDELTRRLSPGDVAFFFFAGHGVNIAGGNFILPADVPNVEAGQETRLARAALGESDILGDLQQRGVRVAVVVLDACRDNPFQRPGVRSVGGQRGLARVEAVRGVFTMYSAGMGQTALDRLGNADPDPNSVFTRVLVPNLAKPGVDLTELAVTVREEVGRLAGTVGHDQRPAYYDETIGGRIYLAGVPLAGPSVASPPQIAAPATAPVAPPLNPQVAAVAPPAAGPARPAPCGNDAAVTVSLSARTAQPLTRAEECALKPKDSFKECEACPEMVVVPAGRFTMGSPASENERDDDEGPQHAVTIARPFAAGKFAVTVDQFAAFITETGHDPGSKCETFESGEGQVREGRSWRKPGFAQAGSHPVVCVSWHDAKSYADWLSRKTGQTYRLLSEAEREYVTRAGTTTPFWWGSSISTQQANYDGNYTYGKGAKGRYRRQTEPVDSFQPNPWGLHQVHGNVSEWTRDCWHDNYNGAPSDGSAWELGDCNFRALHGGSWFNTPNYLRSASRNSDASENRGGDVGFRLGRTLTP